MSKLNVIYIRGVSDEVKKSLSRLAVKNRQSVNQFVLSVLDKTTDVDRIVHREPLKKLTHPNKKNNK